MAGSVDHKPLRILMTADTVGGVWTYAIQLCSSLSDSNVHFHLVTTGAPMQASQKLEAESLANVTVYDAGFQLEWMEEPWESIAEGGKWLLQLEKDLQPDLIHLNCYAYGALAWQAPVIVVAHSDVYSWWHSVNNSAPPASWDKYYQNVRSGLMGANYLVAPSATMMKYIRELYGINKPGQVVYNGTSAESFFPDADKERHIFSMGRLWDQAKNIQLLVAAAPAIDYPIKLAGDASFAGNHGASSGTNITYMGRLSSAVIAKQLIAAAVYVLPAKYEPFGLSILEAALSGCALILGDISSLREIWNDSAFFVDTSDAGGLADTVNYLMVDEAVRIEYVQRSRRQAKQYTASVMGGKYFNLYQQLVSRPAAAMAY
ncbi:glycosyltransferase [Segetibacter sp. 3557_3]|uniref:glycosyltransferase family 4 protein n=1 Tax=Segetibacter sp. 3557_3 TaxID=2547429 RepID=UPI001058D72A|nr:glycosyltransferase family 4 protein [Segetibacter sp. 3557_3]TDH25252.1 glycosyltransferase [Segetibacter sp. 3557_3]